MTAQSLDGRNGHPIEIDFCAPCQVFWFDEHESLRLSPRATLTLFRLIGEQADQPRRALSPVLKCPRCTAHLRLTHDRQRNVPFQYQRCPHGHGRLTTHFDFLREKNVVRPLAAEQLEQLRTHVQNVNCSNCGGPVDLASGSTCTHCGSPLSIVDLGQADATIARLQQADNPSAEPDPLLPLRLAAARRDVERSFAELGRGAEHPAGLLSVDLVSAGLRVLSDWLKR